MHRLAVPKSPFLLCCCKCHYSLSSGMARVSDNEFSDLFFSFFFFFSHKKCTFILFVFDFLISVLIFYFLFVFLALL